MPQVLLLFLNLLHEIPTKTTTTTMALLWVYK
jgi:hypothetical protein